MIEEKKELDKLLELLDCATVVGSAKITASKALHRSTSEEE